VTNALLMLRAGVESSVHQTITWPDLKKVCASHVGLDCNRVESMAAPLRRLLAPNASLLAAPRG
jgi:hypothetical protein